MASKQVVTFDNALEILLARVPEFGAHRSATPDDDLVYPVFGEFARFLNDLLSRVPPAHPTVKRSFDLLNEMGNSEDKRIAHLTATGVFEILTESQASIRAARQLLYGRALDWLEEMIRMWGVEVRDP